MHTCPARATRKSTLAPLPEPCDTLIMDIAKIITRNGHQYVELPEDLRFEEGEFYIKRVASGIILIPKSRPWELSFTAADEFAARLTIERDQPACQQERDLSF